VRSAAGLFVVFAGALVAASLASADSSDPKVKIVAADQRAASAAVLRFSDLGGAWTGGATKPTSLKIPVCAAGNPNNSDLVITGHAESVVSLQSQGITFDSDALVLASAEQAQRLVSRMMRPDLPQCLAFDLERSGLLGASYTVGLVSKLAVPSVGDDSAGFRFPVSVKVNGKKVNVLADYLFVTKDRTQFFVVVTAPSNLGAALSTLESHVAHTLAGRGR
jgi:hypothetical protein